jgi:hypothetical protein
MFLLLVLAVVLHQAYATMIDKADRWPLRTLLLRLIECTGRITIFPIAGYFFISGIGDLSHMLLWGMILVILPVTGFIATREFFGVWKAKRDALNGLLAKINGPSLKVEELSKIEIFVFNLWMFRLVSTSPDRIASELSKYGEIVNVREQKIDLRHFSTAQDLIRGSSNRGSVTQPVEIAMVNMHSQAFTRSPLATSFYSKPLQTTAKQDDVDNNRPSNISPPKSVPDMDLDTGVRFRRSALDRDSDDEDVQ